MSTVKKKILATIKRLPEELSYGEAIEAIQLAQEIDEGLKHVSQGKTTPHEMVKQEIQDFVQEYKAKKK
jgi:predicted transcriptional regulator